MSLSQAAPRAPLHRRVIDIVGYEREDGLFDIEAQLTDTKSYTFTLPGRGVVEPGVPLHRMLARMTIDEDMLIHRFEAATEFAPYSVCPLAAPNYEALAGLHIGRGFLKAAQARVGGVTGCTHLSEMLGQMGTVALQTLYHRRMQRSGPNPAVLDSCLGWEAGGEAARRTFPDRYTAAAITPA